MLCESAAISFRAPQLALQHIASLAIAETSHPLILDCAESKRLVLTEDIVFFAPHQYPPIPEVQG